MMIRRTFCIEDEKMHLNLTHALSKPWRLLAVLLCAALTAIAQPLPSAAAAETVAGQNLTVLRIHGSNTMGAALVPKLVEAWLKSSGWRGVQKRSVAFDEQTILATHPDGRRIQVELQAHGTSTGVADLIANKCDIAMASRAVKPEERAQNSAQNGIDLVGREHVIALDGVAVVVNPKNPLAQIDLGTLRAIFTGKKTAWSAENVIGNATIRVLARDAQSGTFDAFKALVLEGSDIAGGAQRFESNRAIAEQVAQDINSIGFLSLSELGGTKALAIDAGGMRAASPSMASIAVEDYPLTRRLSFYTRARGPNLGEAFVRYALGNEAQKIVGDLGFVNLAVRAVDAPNLANAPSDYGRFIQGAKRLSVNFRFTNSIAILDNRAKMDIYRLAAFMSRAEGPGILKLAGFTDNSLRKAALADSMSEVWAEFVADGLNKSKVRVHELRGFGAAMPVADNANARGRELNRRVEVWWVPSVPRPAATPNALKPKALKPATFGVQPVHPTSSAATR